MNILQIHKHYLTDQERQEDCENFFVGTHVLFNIQEQFSSFRKDMNSLFRECKDASESDS